MLLSCTFALTGHAKTETPTELVWLTWTDYDNPDLTREFEQRYHAKVRRVYFDADEMRNEILLSTDGAGYDLVTVNGAYMALYVKRDWLEPLSKKDIPNLENIDPYWLGAFEGSLNYGAPYMWGTLGIAYRKDLVPEPITSWRQFFNPPEALRGKIIMLKDSRDVIGMALKSMGYSLNSTDPAQLDAAERLLMAQKPYINAYSYLLLNEDSPLMTGSAWMATVFNGDGIFMHNKNPNIEYVLPEEGSTIWVDNLTVMRASRQKRLAMQFINFMNEPHNAARLALFMNFATPNRRAEALLPASFRNNPMIYPPKKILEKSEFYKALPAETMKKRIGLFNRVVN